MKPGTAVIGAKYTLTHGIGYGCPPTCTARGDCIAPRVRSGLVVRVRALHYVQPHRHADVIGRGLLCTPVRPTLEQMEAWNPTIWWRAIDPATWHAQGLLIWEAELGERVA